MFQGSADLLTPRARLTPDREAVLEAASGQRLTYGQLNRRANQTAHSLRALGVRPGDRVMILAYNSLIYLDLFFAAGKMGAVLAPLNWRLAAAEMAGIVADCSPRLVIYGPELAATAAETEVIVNHAVERGRNDATVMNDDTGGPRWLSQAAFEAATAAHPTTQPPDEALTGESPYCLLYTSGTTGRPKGAIIPHRQVLWNAINTAVSWGLTGQDVSPIFTPLFHAGGLFAFLTPLIYLGGRLVLTRTFDAAESLRLIAEEGCTVILGVPTLLQMWLESPAITRTDFSQVRFFISGGAPCPAWLMRQWRQQTGTVLRQGYGLSEVGPNCFSMTDAESESSSGTVGKPVFHSQVRLVDAAGREVAVGETGELIIRGPHVCSGYWNNPQATGEALRAGWFHTGDMARQDADGFFTIVGRFKDMIISGGENIYAAEVEAVFLEHPAVAACALLGEPDPRWGEVGVLVVVLKGGVTPSQTIVNHTVDPSTEAISAELRAHGLARLARYKLPRRFVFTDELPYSPYGKVQKAQLAAMIGVSA